jgi:dTDP-4-dehydrorhamnose reductase
MILKKKILITGGSGLLALNSALYLRNDYDIYLGLHNRMISLDGVMTCKLNLENESELEKTLSIIKPDIIINAAGMTNVEECESKPEEALKINSIIPGVLARISKKIGIYFIHISTDHLFNGTKSLVTEIEETCPLNTYGKSKELGEKEVLINNSDALILRTNFFGWGTQYRKSFSDTIISSLRNNKKIILFDDVYYTPILILNLVEVIKELIKNKISGIYNLVSSERITKFDFGVLISKIFNLDTNLIVRGTLSYETQLVKRPLDMSLSNQKLNALLNIKIPTLEKQITFLKEQEKTGLSFELKSL